MRASLKLVGHCAFRCSFIQFLVTTFFEWGLSVGWGAVLCNELSVGVVRMVIALNLEEHRYTRGRHHKIVLFVLYNEELSSARSIFRNDFAL